MAAIHLPIRIAACAVFVAGTLAASGCQQLFRPQLFRRPLLRPHPRFLLPAGPGLTTRTPHELHKAILPEYTIEPPDVLIVRAIHAVPRSPYRLRTLDTIAINVMGTLQDEPIEGIFPIEPGGFVSLGFTYGRLQVAGMSVDEAQEAIRKHLLNYLKEPLVTASLADIGATEQVEGEHLVGPDGRVTLGAYGSVSVVGLTKGQTKLAIESHLAEFLDEPEVAVDVLGYNSKVYYVITQGAGLGDNVFSFPVTGNETVLDAIALIGGMDETSSKRVWIARPGRNCEGSDQVLPIDWDAITKLGNVDTNFQVLPGDRVYVAEDHLVAFDTFVSKVTAPFERLFGFSILGAQTATTFSANVLQGGGLYSTGRFGGGFGGGF